MLPGEIAEVGFRARLADRRGSRPKGRSRTIPIEVGATFLNYNVQSCRISPENTTCKYRGVLDYCGIMGWGYDRTRIRILWQSFEARAYRPPGVAPVDLSGKAGFRAPAG